MCVCVCVGVCVCINGQSIEKIKLDFNWIFNFAPRVHLSF